MNEKTKDLFQKTTLLFITAIIFGACYYAGFYMGDRDQIKYDELQILKINLALTQAQTEGYQQGYIIGEQNCYKDVMTKASLPNTFTVGNTTESVELVNTKWLQR